MALSSASAVSPTPAVDNTAKTNTSVATTGNGSAGTFTDNLEAVLAQPATGAGKASTDNGTDSNVALFTSLRLAKLKSKLKNSDATIALAPQTLQQQQAILQSTTAALTPQALQQQQADLHKLSATNTGIDLPALRAAIGKGTHTPGNAHTMPVVNPLTGKVSSAQTAGAAQINALAANVPAVSTDSTATQNSVGAPQTATTTPQAAADAVPKDAGATSSQSAVTAATQEKLLASLVKTAEAPVLKSGQTDGSKVPNAEIAHQAKTEKSTDTETVQSMAAKIAATAAVANPNDTAQTAAQSVAVAEVSARTAAATTTSAVAKIEAAAMTNATQAAVHTPASQEKVEVQALPVQFDAPSAKQDGKDSTQDDTRGKDQGQSGGAHAASAAPQQAATPGNNFADTQPATPANANTASTSTTTADTNAAASTATGVSAPVTPSTIATTLQVSQQPQQSAPSADQATFAALGVVIAAKSKDGEKQFDINMHPAELGRVDVRISVDSDGKAQAHLSAEHPQTLQLLQNDKTTLERNLRDAGLDVANNGLSFSLKGEQQSSTPTFNARSRALSIATVQTTDISSASSSSSIAPGDSRLDIRV